jgi:hypothetical protein
LFRKYKAAVAVGLVLGALFSFAIYYQTKTIANLYSSSTLLVEPTYKLFLLEELDYDYAKFKKLERIVYCESNWKTNAFNARSRDLGLFQINLYYHQNAAEKMGLDLNDPKDNIRYALYLYEKNGTRDWNWSKHCWARKQRSR